MGIETITRQITSTNHSGLAAVNRAQLIKIRNQGLRDCFKHLDDIPHKMEFVARIQDKCFVDDAASCNVNATWYALESTEGPIIWIANGSSDSIDYRKLKTCVSQKVKMILCVGEHAESLHQAFDGVVSQIIDCPSMEYAVNRALYGNVETATVIYSPSTQSGVSVKDSGAAFRREVCEL
ncbi:MAG: hypothetical protein J5711_03135 [Bacteroidales bacterium]|nr:hypothetical protein [Bacteroidales bacterium]